MAAILNFPAPTDIRVTNLNVYRKLPTETAFTRIVQLSVVSTYTDLSGTFGSVYYFTYFDNVRFVESAPSPLIIYSNSLDTVTITGMLSGIDANPMSGVPAYGPGVAGGQVTVDVALQSNSSQAPIFDGQVISGLRQTVNVDANGIFVCSLIPNDLIYPTTGTWYKFDIQGRRFFKTILSSGGSSQLFTALLDVPPFELR